MRHFPEDQADRIERKIDAIERTLAQMALDQQTFDTDLAALVTAITNLDAAIDAWVASHPDLTAEDQTVQTAAAAVAAELAKITPAAPPAPTTP